MKKNEIEEISSIRNEENYKKGDKIISIGDLFKDIIVIHQGNCELWLERKGKYYKGVAYSSNKMIGFMVIVKDDIKFDFDVIAKSDVVIHKYPIEKLRLFLFNHPDISSKILWNFVELGLNHLFSQLQNSEKKVLSRTKKLNDEKKKVEEKNIKLTDSIQYASLIQNSILPRNAELSQYIKDFFIIWKPRDIVGGDFYWFNPIPESKNYIISVIDCTGHGVPGAFMSMTANSILNNIVKEKQIYEPDKILNLLHKEIRYTLRQQSKESQQDGMDISLCFVNVEKQKIHFAGAMQSLYFVRISNIQQGISNDEKIIERIRGDRFSIGGRQKEEERIFTNHKIQYNAGDSIYLLSDGLADQKVRIDGKETSLKTKRVEKMFLKYCKLPMIEQKEKIENELMELQGEIEQRDDIMVIGIKLT